MTEWFENKDFWEKLSELIFSADHWKKAAGEAEQIMSLTSIRAGANILDLCCGPGRHTLELARRGFRVTGVDLISAHLKQGIKRAAEEGLRVEWIQEDMRNFVRQDFFDAALMMYTSFGYFYEKNQNQRVLDNVYASLKSGGVLIMEMMGKEVLARIFRERDWSERDGVFFLQERSLRDDWSWIDNRWLVYDGVQMHEFTFGHCIYSASELKTMILESGFSSVETYGNLTGMPYDQHAERLVVVARKKIEH